MTTAIAALEVGQQVLNLTEEIEVHAPLDTTFAALLEQLGPGADTPDGRSMPMKLEAWPGGRWYRDLGNGDGHLWGHVQAIKRPTLVELWGPLFMSYACVSNVQYRLSECTGGTLITFHHFGFGAIPDGYAPHIGTGWKHILDGIRTRAEAASGTAPRN
jgi:hypothetical protein